MKTTTMRGIILSLFVSVATAGCGNGGSSDAATTADMTVAGMPDLSSPSPDMTVAASDYSCVGKVNLPVPAKPMYTFPLVIVDFQNMMPLQGVTVKVCAPADAMCANPLSTGMTDASGMLMITAPSSKTGIAAYFDITNPAYVETLGYYNVVHPDTTIGAGKPLGAFIFSGNSFKLLSNLVGVMPDPMRGAVAVTGLDCTGVRGIGLTAITTANADAMSHVFYIEKNLPSKTAMITDSYGSALITNVPAGMTTASAKYGTMVYSSQDIIVRPTALTFTYLVPLM